MQVSRKKRICFVSLEIHPTTPGGAGILIRHTASLLLKVGYEVVLLLNLPDNEIAQFRDHDRFLFPNSNNLSVYQVSALCAGMPPLPSAVDDVFKVSARLAYALNRLQELESIDFIEFYDYCGPGWHYLATPHANIPIGVRLHSTVELIERRVRQGVTPQRIRHYAMERAQLALADGVLYPGARFLDEEVAPLYPELDKARAHASAPVLEGIDPVHIEQDAHNILFYGRLSTLKGLDTVLRGLAFALEDATFAAWLNDVRIVGPDETVASALTLEEMCSVVPEAHRSKLKFIGRVTHEQLAAQVKNSAFAIFANKIESFCYAAHELHVMGLPLILTPLPAFRDHFTNEESALFFDGSARDLGAAMIRMAGDADLRAKLSAFGAARAPHYAVNHYDAHLEAIAPRRQEGAAPVETTAIIFSDGDKAAEAKTIDSLSGVCANTIVLRQNDSEGWAISGARFTAHVAGRATANAALEPLGGAVLGLRAGDSLNPDWLEEAATLLGADEKVGAVGCWRTSLTGTETSVAHLVPEAALLDRMGLRQLIRIRPGLVFSELAADMKASGEAALVFAQRGAGRVVLESPRLGVDTREARPTPLFDVGMATSVDFDRMNGDFFALQGALADEIDASGVTARRSHGVAHPTELAAALDPSRCIIRSRPDIQPGELWLMDVHVSGNAARTPWSAIAFDSSGWERRVDEKGVRAAYVCSWWGEASFQATPESTFDVLTGPFCGVCEVIFGGVRTLVNLRVTNPAKLRLRLSDVLGLTTPLGEAAGEAPPPPPAYLEAARARDSGAHRAVIVSDGRCWLMKQTALGAAAAPRVSMADIAGGAGGVVEAAAHLLRAARTGAVDRVIISATSERAVEFADYLSRAPDGPLVVAALAPGAEPDGAQQFYAADVAIAGRLRRHVRGRESRFMIASPDAGMLAPFAALGARTMKLSPFPAEPRLKASATGRVSFVVVGGSRIAPVRTHLLGGALLLRTRFGRDAQILLPHDDPHLLAVANAFGAQNVRAYQRLENTAPRSDERRIALAVFPDGQTPPEVERVAAAGCLPLIGPSGLWGESAPALQVSFWEDATAIADQAEAAINNWAHSCELVANAAQRARETSLRQAAELLGAPVRAEAKAARV